VAACPSGAPAMDNCAARLSLFSCVMSAMALTASTESS